ncbi:lipocalin-like protein [Flavobacteriaceae bacterium MAR_2010_105]|nr:lipocalin-like protein [Flavobacteriaceae bacterium MAR_2010_105]
MKKVIVISLCIVLSIISCKQNAETINSSDKKENVTIANENFDGSWELKQWTAELTNGEIVFPYGEDAKGILTYDKFGNMAVQVMKSKRPKFLSEDPLNAQPEEVWEAYNGFIAYIGSYEVDTSSNKVIHRIRLSSFPNWVGQNQVRYYEFKDDNLILSTDLIGASKHKLIWEKLNTTLNNQH